MITGAYLHISLWWILLTGIITGLIFGKVFFRWVCPKGLIMKIMMGMSPEGTIKQMYMYHKVGCPIALYKSGLSKPGNSYTCSKCLSCVESCLNGSLKYRVNI